MTATDTAVIAGRFIDVPKLRGHYRGPGATAGTNFSQNIGARRRQQGVGAIGPC
jgi:hypothetical protein